jgi:hypothetical protein
MDYDNQQKLTYWNRKITNACWLILLVSMIIELLMSFVSYTDFCIYVYNSVFVPTVYMLFVMICTEIAIRLFKPLTDYINITACLLLSSVLFWVHVSVPPIQGVLFLPFIFSIFYFRKSRVMFACIATIIMACFLYLNLDYFINQNRLLFLFTAVAMLSFAYYIALIIMKRGIELLNDLKTTMNAQQELFLKIW